MYTFRFTFLFIILSALTFRASAQDIDIIKADREFFWGESCSENQKEASDQAISQILTQISVKVTSDFRSFSKIDTENDTQNYESKVEGVVKTYASGALTNLQNYKEPRDCGIYAFYYINRDEIDKIFDYRKQLVKDIFDKAERYEKDANFAAALKYYYFSSILLNSIPVSRVEHKGMPLEIEIGSRLSDIINSTRFEVINDEMVSDKRREITISITVKNKPAKSLDFNFWDGSNQIDAKSIDGTALITLFGSSTQFNELQMRVKYKYFESKEEIKEVGELWSLVSAVNIANRQRVKLEVNPKPKPEALAEFGLATVTDNIELHFTADDGEEVEDLNTVEKALNVEELKEVVPEHLVSLEEYFNNDKKVAAWEQDDFLSDKLSRMKKYNKLDISKISSRQNINNTYEGWEFRQMSANASYRTMNMQSKEYVVPDFDTTGRMMDVNFGIMDGLYDTFKRASTFGDDWDKRQVIIKFVEKYRTAYLTRDMEQLDVMFADEAVIIVGRILRKDEEDTNSYELDNNDRQPDVEYLRLDKQRFLERQAQIFGRENNDIHLGFTTFEIKKKNNQDGVYGVSMRQNYTSTGYADEGYLFLLIDFNGKEPKIYVRAWQPQEWDEDALIELANFRVNF
jgi:hypothetical protein